MAQLMAGGACYFEFGIYKIFMWEIIIKSFYFVLPAYLANMSPVIFDKLKIFKFFAKPIDGGKKIGQDFIFGSSKTWRGIFSGAIFGIIISLIQALLYNYDFFRSLSIINYQNVFLVFGLLAGVGAILGDLAKSFFKRRLGIKSGQSWPVFDQLDFVIGFFVFTYYLSYPPIELMITAMLITLVLHPLTNIVSYWFGFKKVWW